MKTIFITSFHAYISRNILATDFLSAFKSRDDLEIVILVPAYKRDYFIKNFGSRNIKIEGIDTGQASGHKIGLFFKRLGRYLFDNETGRTTRNYKFYRDRKIFNFLFALLMGKLGRSFSLRSCVRFFDYHLSPKGFFLDLLEEYKPALIFSTDVQNENDVSLMHDAKTKNIPVVAMVRSWDNPSKYTLRVFPKWLLVTSETLKEEVTAFYRFPEEKIFVVGFPHYGRYSKAPITKKAEFFAKLGLNPNKRLILFSPAGDDLIKYNDYDQNIMEILSGIDANILVRFPPDSFVKLTNFLKPANMVIDIPGFVFNKSEVHNREISRADDDRLIDSIYYSDIVITGPTSICLDSIFFDRPVIAPDFYPTKRNFYDTLYGYRYYHFLKLLRTGGVRYVKSRDAFLSAIEAYFKNPALDRDKRALVRSMWFSHGDGESGLLMAKKVISFLS